MTHFHLILSVRWHTFALISHLTHLCFSVHDHYAGFILDGLIDISRWVGPRLVTICKLNGFAWIVRSGIAVISSMLKHVKIYDSGFLTRDGYACHILYELDIVIQILFDLYNKLYSWAHMAIVTYKDQVISLTQHRIPYLLWSRGLGTTVNGVRNRLQRPGPLSLVLLKQTHLLKDIENWKEIQQIIHDCSRKDKYID